MSFTACVTYFRDHSEHRDLLYSQGTKLQIGLYVFIGYRCVSHLPQSYMLLVEEEYMVAFLYLVVRQSQFQLFQLQGQGRLRGGLESIQAPFQAMRVSFM